MASEHPQFDYCTEFWIWSFSSSSTNYHYARWLTVHVNDLISLENNSPLTHAEFLTGRFVTQKTRRKVHEQLNAIVKGDGGIIGITENEAALTR